MLESLDGRFEDPYDRFTGLSVIMDHYNFHRVKIGSYYKGQADYDEGDAKAINIGSIGAWYNIKLTLENGFYTLSVYDSNNDLVGTVSDTLPAEHSHYRYLGIFSHDPGGSESADGYLDDLILYGSPAAVLFDDFSTDQGWIDDSNGDI